MVHEISSKPMKGKIMFKRKLHFLYILSGFILGASYIVACGSGSNSLAQPVENAIEVAFDNSNSKLNATNLQAAIDELNEKVDALETGGVLPLKQSDLVGTWKGETIFLNPQGKRFSNISLTINANGTYSCSGDPTVQGRYTHNNEFFSPNSESPVCKNPVSWSVIKRAIIITFNYEGELKELAYPVYYFDSSNIEILTGQSDNSFAVTSLSR